MIKIFSIICISFFTVSPIVGQYIVAGQIGTEDYYKDFEPDIILDIDMSCYYNGDSFLLDMNQDGIDDFKISTYGIGCNGGGTGDCIINGMYPEAKVISHPDTVFPPDNPPVAFIIADTLNSGDTIPGHYSINGGTYLWAYYYGPIYEHPLNYYWWDIGPHYVGVYFGESNETYYGWIKISTTYVSTIIHAYGYNLTPYIGVEEETEKLEFEIFPNPSKDHLHIKIKDIIEGDIIIYNSNSKAVLTKIHKGSSNKINISNLPNGMYFLTIHTDRQKYMKKFIKK